MTQQPKRLAAKPDNTGLTPKTQLVDGENQLPQAVPRPSQARLGMHTHTHDEWIGEWMSENLKTKKQNTAFWVLVFVSIG